MKHLDETDWVEIKICALLVSIGAVQYFQGNESAGSVMALMTLGWVMGKALRR